jgi:tripartite-type tricarboxylate transporter receptor subunit TctC
MQMQMRRRTVIQGLAAACVGAGRPLRADSFPSRPITFIVPATPGGLLDTFMRGSTKLAAPYLNNQPMVIENRPGASLLLGAEAMARLDHGDGYLLTQGLQVQVRMPHMRAVNYDPFKDFTWIISQVGSPFGVAVRADSPYQSFDDLLAAAKARPGEVSYATVGVGNGGHLLMEEVARLKGVKWIMVPVKGSTEGIQGALGGHYDCVADSVSWAPQVAAGKMRLLLQFGDGRLKKFPQAPSAQELGMPLVYTSPVGLIGPKKMDPQVVQILHDAFRKAAEQPEYLELLDRFDLFPLYKNPADFTATMRQEYERERALVTRLGLQAK